MDINEELGFSPDDIVIVVHADDMGMCSATNNGCLSLFQKKAITSSSVMVPCPGFDEVVEMNKENEGLDLGVHLTFIAEGDDDAFWRPVSDDVPSLINNQGTLHTTPADFFKHATIDDVEKECRAQIEKAINAGLDITHIDSHMGTLFNGSLIVLYAKLAIEYGVVCMLPIVKLYDTFLQRFYIQAVKLLHENRWPGLFHVNPDMHPDLADDPSASFERRMQMLHPGLNYWIIHPADPAYYTHETVLEDTQERASTYHFYRNQWVTAREQRNIFDSMVDGVVTMRDILDACALKDSEKVRRIIYSF